MSSSALGPRRDQKQHPKPYLEHFQPLGSEVIVLRPILARSSFLRPLNWAAEAQPHELPPNQYQTYPDIREEITDVMRARFG